MHLLEQHAPNAAGRMMNVVSYPPHSPLSIATSPRKIDFSYQPANLQYCTASNTPISTSAL
ncbi:hypothetical protein J6590_021031 [Homalodisca vitripennis]|nr:hypothetical protein J6590_021031 [Homalodisca vitripennis]